MNWNTFKEFEQAKHTFLTSKADAFYAKHPTNQITFVCYDELGPIAKKAFEELENEHLCFEGFEGHYAKAYYLYIQEDEFDDDAVKAFDVCLAMFQLMKELQ